MPGRGVVNGPAPRQDLGQAPVHHLHLAEAADHDVRRLEIAVDHSPGVRVRHRLRHLEEDGEQPRPVVPRPATVAEDLGQGTALDQLHGEERPAIGEGAELVDRHDPRVLELAGDLRLLDEAADQLGLVAVLLQEDLDGQVAAQVGVAALEHGPHAAPGDLAQDLERSAPVRRRGHGVAAGPGGRLDAAIGVAEQDVGDRADRGSQVRQHPRGAVSIQGHRVAHGVAGALAE